jgi:hypothetical protein
MVQTQPMSDPRSAIMGTNKKPFMAQAPHDSDNVARHSTLCVRRVRRIGRWLVRPTVAAQIRANNLKRAGQNGGHTVPHGGSLRIPMQ